MHLDITTCCLRFIHWFGLALKPMATLHLRRQIASGSFFEQNLFSLHCVTRSSKRNLKGRVTPLRACPGDSARMESKRSFENIFGGRVTNAPIL